MCSSNNFHDDDDDDDHISLNKYSLATEEELQCLAAWKEGSNRYFLGLIQHRDHTSYEDRFRCFAYEVKFKFSILFLWIPC